MPEYVRENAVIERTMLGWEDHGIFTFSLTLDYGGAGQTAGNLCLSYSPRDYGRELFSPGGLELIGEVMKTVGAGRWEELKGRNIVALLDKPYGMVVGIGHFLKKDQTLVFKDFMEDALDRASEDLAKTMEDRSVKA